jgi:hypothetical protein
MAGAIALLVVADGALAVAPAWNILKRAQAIRLAVGAGED